MRIIDADELLKKEKTIHIEEVGYTHRSIDPIDVIEAPTIEAEPRWIPCSDRLPVYDEKVIAFVINKDPEGRFNNDGIYIAELKDKVPKHDPEGNYNFWGIPGYDSQWTVWAWSYFTEPDVIAWMPLPEPYSEVEE